MILAVRLAPLVLDVLPDVVTVKVGWKARVAQLVAWNGTVIDWLVFSLLVIVPVIWVGAQLVGLNVKCSRVIVTLTFWMFTGIPSIRCGIACGPLESVLTVRAAV